MKMRIRSNTMLRLGALLTALTFGGMELWSCSDDGAISGFNGKKGGSGGKKSKVSSNDKDGDGIADAEDDDITDGPGASGAPTRSIDNSGANFQVKDIELLRNSIDACMGSDMTKISSDMLLPAVGAEVPAAGAGLDKKLGLVQGEPKVKFLLPTPANAIGNDIIDVERGNLVDLTNSSRTAVAGDSLTDTYLRALETIANVVAHNCTADKKECECGSKKKARAMLSRCLPSLDPETKEMDEASSMLGTICAKDERGMRKAIASMIASYAFAGAR